MHSVVQAVKEALPGVEVFSIFGHVEGYGNDRWNVESSIGPLLIKVRRIPEPDPKQIDRQIRVQQWLTSINLPTPELLHVEWENRWLDGRAFSIQRYVDGPPAVDALSNHLGPSARRAFYDELGRIVGRFHSFALPEFEGWIGHYGSTHDTWVSAVRPTECFRIIRDHGSLVPLDALAEAERRVDYGLALLPDIQPHLTHRDLHLGNVLAADGVRPMLIDLELVKEWDPVWDFSQRLDGVFDHFSGSREPFLEGYRETAGPLPDSFPLRNWLYHGIDHVVCVKEHLDGNDGYVNKPKELLAWLELPMAE